MERMGSVAIVGVGLIGGSIGLAVKARGQSGRVIGIGRSAARLREAVARGAIDEATTDLAGGVAEADVVVVRILGGRFTPSGDELLDIANQRVAVPRPNTAREIVIFNQFRAGNRSGELSSLPDRDDNVRAAVQHERGRPHVRQDRGDIELLVHQHKRLVGAGAARQSLELPQKRLFALFLARCADYPFHHLAGPPIGEDLRRIRLERLVGDVVAPLRNPPRGG